MQKIMMLVCCLLAWSLWPQLAQTVELTQLRSSISPARVRLVVDGDGPVAYRLQDSGSRLELYLEGTTKINRQLRLDDTYVQQAELVRKGSHSLLRINKEDHCQYKIYALENPHRLVVDIFRINLVQESRELEPGVVHTYLQDEINGQQIQAHVIAVSPQANFELRPFSAAGTYNGRGLLTKAASAYGARIAVNASYFDSSGWVIGVNKDRGQLMSVDATPRSAYVDNGLQRFFIKDVAYRGQVQLPQGGTLPIKGMNRERITDDVVLYNEYFASSTKTNQWGIEIKLRNHRIIDISTQGNMSIEPGTQVLSAHGYAHKNALSQLKVGDTLELQESLGSTWADQAKIIVGGGPLLLENGQVNVRTREEFIASDIAWGRAPRTALGLKRDGTLLLLVVDGRSKQSKGLTLEELAIYFLRLGARDALNLDGGGSSIMVIDGQAVNHPSDGRERPVSIGVGLFKKR